MPLNGSLERNSIYVSLDARPSPGEYVRYLKSLAACGH